MKKRENATNCIEKKKEKKTVEKKPPQSNW